MEKKVGLMKVLENKLIACDVFQMTLQGEVSKFITKPGQFINIKINDSKEPYLRRPISICDSYEDKLVIIYKVVGEGTRMLSEVKNGQTLDVLSGLGNGYEIIDNKKSIIISGGLGVPPMYKLVKELVKKGIDVTVVLGFKSKSDVFYEDEFKALCPTYVSTDDGSYGYHGNVLDVIKEEKIDFEYYYSCGAKPLLNALVKKYPDNGQLSFEARMACGFGACMGCTCKVDGGYKRLCKEGPVLKSSEVILDD